MSRAVTIEVPGAESDPNPDETLAHDAGAMTAKIFIEDLKRGVVPPTQAAIRMRAGVALWRPIVENTGASGFYVHLSECFQTGFVNELARRLA